MAQDADAFRLINAEEWDTLKSEFKLNWPRCVTGNSASDTSATWLPRGKGNGFKVLNPYGNPKNGIVAVTKDETEYTEMLIECPTEDTSKLEEAFKSTKLIDWTKDIVILFAQTHVVECLKRIEKCIPTNIDFIHPVFMYILKKDTPPFDVKLPPGHTFKLLSEEYIELVDSKWPHRYPGSTKYFDLLIKSKSGFGIFKENDIISWGFIKEMGALGHLYTLEEHRNKGFGVMITKLICNEVLKTGKDVFSFCVGNNFQACKMHEKIGFEKKLDFFSVGFKMSEKIE